MAAITPDTPTGQQVAGAFGNVGTMGFRHVTLPFLSDDAVDGGDTYTPGGWIGIARAAWEGTTSGDECAVTITDATPTAQGFVTFNATTDNIEGYLHLWISN